MDTVSPKKRSEIMRAIKPRGNKTTELRMASLLRKEKIWGWRRHADLPGTPDFVWKRERVALFVHGCYWHFCGSHCKVPKTNVKFWRDKLMNNRDRDRRAARALRRLGWRVVTVWEHDLK